MIDIKIERKYNKIMFSALGHADYAPYGHDIVCAGVSSIISGLCSSLDYGSHETHLSSGRAIIRAKYTRNNKCLFRFAEKALGLIATEYPKSVKLSVYNAALNA